MSGAILSFCLAASVGLLLVILSQRLHIPSIVLLLAGGVLMGPQVLHLIDPTSLGQGLETLTALLVAIILFEGGLTLDIAGYRRASKVIRRLLTVGMLFTWLTAAVAIHLLLGLGLGLSFMASSLVIVTGPTVVLPLLRRIHIKERLHHVLYWEAVLIDPIGVFVAVLCYEWLTPALGENPLLALGHFGLRLLVGLGVGLASGLLTSWILKRTRMGPEQSNLFVLASALATYGGSHALVNESGILSMVVAGLVIGIVHPPQLRFIKQFKLALTEFSIGVLFILLSAKLNLSLFRGIGLVVLLVLLIFLIRPAVVWIATAGQGFRLREKALLSWIAPRGIVAAAMASLFSLRLSAQGEPQAVMLETITYAVIAVTVTLQGLSAPLVVRLMGLKQADRKTWVLLGDEALVAALERGLRRAGVNVIPKARQGADREEEDLDAPRYADVASVLCAHPTTMYQTCDIQQWITRIPAEFCYHWKGASSDHTESSPAQDSPEVPVWSSSLSPSDVAHGLNTGMLSVDVVEVGDPDEQGRFGKDLQPLFWVSHGHATIVADPLQPGPPQGDLAVVLRRKIPHLSRLIAHVDLIDIPSATFEKVLQRLATSAHELHPELEMRSVVDGIIERWHTMTVAVGGGVAIPHAYCDGLEHSLCFLAAIPSGLDMDTPDGLPVHLVFLLISPAGKATAHLESLAALATLAEDREFLDLLIRQQAPGRIARLILERA
ncbi:MAG: cation:proton antiporter [Bradymonadales bacterium]|nr:cation:proton antiporter [Bradymonadales bacterium]